MAKYNIAAAEEDLSTVDLDSSAQKCNTTFSDEQKQKILFVTGFTAVVTAQHIPNFNSLTNRIKCTLEG